MTARKLDDTFEVLGEWFLSTNHEDRIGGVLSYNAGRIELRVNRAFVPMRGVLRFTDPVQRYAVIYGTTTDGEAVTLIEALRINASVNFGSGGLREPERIVAKFLFIGGFIAPDGLCPQMRFRVPGLEVWLSKPAIETTLHRDGPGATYRIVPIDKLATPIASLGINIEWACSWGEMQSNAFSSLAIEVSGWIKIEPSSPQPIPWFFEQQLKFMGLLTFLAGAPMPPDHIETSTQDRRDVSVLAGLQHTAHCTYKNVQEFFIPRNGMNASLQDVVSRWFEIHPTIGPAAQLGLSVLASSGTQWIHLEFLSLMQALEGFHRALWTGKYTDDEVYKAVADALMKAIPQELEPDHRASLTSRLKYGNEISLRKRLRALAEHLSEPIRRVILGGEGRVPSRWIDTRNYYTHWDKSLLGNVLGIQELHDANVRMRHFLRVLYLKTMGIPDEALLSALQNDSGVAEDLRQLNAIQRRQEDPAHESGVMAVVTEEPTVAENERDESLGEKKAE